MIGTKFSVLTLTLVTHKNGYYLYVYRYLRLIIENSNCMIRRTQFFLRCGKNTTTCTYVAYIFCIFLNSIKVKP